MRRKRIGKRGLEREDRRERIGEREDWRERGWDDVFNYILFFYFGYFIFFWFFLVFLVVDCL